MKIWPIMLALILLILLVAGLFFYFATASSPEPRVVVENPTKNLAEEEAVMYFNEDYVDYLVFSIGGWKLHNPPLSDNTPKIKVIADSETFVSEVRDGEIITKKQDIESDIIIITTKEEIVDAVLSDNMKKYLKSSVQQGKTTLKLKASYNVLFSKGYLSIYKDITGKSFTASAIRIFQQD